MNLRPIGQGHIREVAHDVVGIACGSRAIRLGQQFTVGCVGIAVRAMAQQSVLVIISRNSVAVDGSPVPVGIVSIGGLRAVGSGRVQPAFLVVAIAVAMVHAVDSLGLSADAANVVASVGYAVERGATRS